MNDIVSTGTGWPDPDLQAEFDGVIVEALAGRMPATRLRLAEQVIAALVRSNIAITEHPELQEALKAYGNCCDKAVAP